MDEPDWHVAGREVADPSGRPVYSLILGTNVMIVLSTDKAVKDLLDKRSNIYSSRTEMYLGNLASGYLRVLLMVSFFASGTCFLGRYLGINEV